VVLPFSSAAEIAAATCYVAKLRELGPHYGFGHIDGQLAKQAMPARAAAAYLSSYFVTGSNRKAVLQESVMSPSMPRSIIHVSSKLTQRTGVTMRELRFRRFVWFLADRFACPLAEARLIATQATAGTLDLTVDVFLPSPAPDRAGPGATASTGASRLDELVWTRIADVLAKPRV
jgi:hypothetical protein